VTIRLYLDDDSLDKALVKALRDNKIDVVTTREPAWPVAMMKST